MLTLSQALAPFVLTLSFAAASAAPLGTTQGGDVRELLSIGVASADRASVPELWQRAFALRDAARELKSEGLDSAAEQALETAGVGEHATLLLVALRLQGGDTATCKAKLAERLTPLLASKEDELVCAAAGLFADATFRTLEQAERRSLIERLLAVAAGVGAERRSWVGLPHAGLRHSGGVGPVHLGRLHECRRSNEPPRRRAAADQFQQGPWCGSSGKSLGKRVVPRLHFAARILRHGARPRGRKRLGQELWLAGDG